MQQTDNSKRFIIATVVVVAVMAAVIAGVALSGKSETEADSATSTGTSQSSADSTTTTSDAADSSATYKDGTYTATGGYNSPGGAESIEVSLTLKDGVITDSTVTGNASGGEAEYHQKDFIDAYKEYVVGKSIKDLKLSRIAGASLTTNGFNNAIAQIKSQAQS